MGFLLYIGTNYFDIIDNGLVYFENLISVVKYVVALSEYPLYNIIIVYSTRDHIILTEDFR